MNKMDSSAKKVNDQEKKIFIDPKEELLHDEIRKYEKNINHIKNLIDANKELSKESIDIEENVNKILQTFRNLSKTELQHKLFFTILPQHFAEHYTAYSLFLPRAFIETLML